MICTKLTWFPWILPLNWNTSLWRLIDDLCWAWSDSLGAPFENIILSLQIFRWEVSLWHWEWSRVLPLSFESCTPSASVFWPRWGLPWRGFALCRGWLPSKGHSQLQTDGPQNRRKLRASEVKNGFERGPLPHPLPKSKNKF